ncbi:DUF7537 family lipoprotein [Halogranum rubrum]|uniref:Lipoprotein n=1 Tax=Halogranum salarium B-1 TaxID=1210908 RepID=J3EZX7_9EURY|nr:hypothetical protein [Halogranum salarium]EJN61237.1 hypothetical protein HSB1_02780 [Halogranum salarium B-1]
MRLVLHLSLALLVVCAGCSGTPGFGPSETPTRQPTATPAAPPAGLSTDSVTDARALAESHRTVLDSTSYTVNYQQTVRYQNGTVFSQTNATHRVSSDETAWAALSVDGAYPLFLGGVAGGMETWTNESLSITEIETADQSMYQRGIERRGPASFSAAYSLLEPLHLTTTGRTGVGAGTRYHLTTTEPAATNAFGLGGAPARNATLTAAVDGDGVLRHYELQYTTEFRNETLHVTQTMRIGGVGETTVPRPEWVDDALEKTKDQPR